MKLTKLFVTSFVLFFVLSGITFAEDKFDYGEDWSKASVREKMLFVDGYQSGFLFGVMQATRNFMPTGTQSEKESAFARASMIYGDRRFAKDMLVEVVLHMNLLYKDPENKFIERGIIFEFAVDRARGIDVTKDLEQQRKAAEGDK